MEDAGGRRLFDGGALAQSVVPIPVTISGPSPWIDVKAYGAKGDGVTDDSGAIQGAINACPANGCTIYFPSSATYKIGTGLTISSSQPGIKLLGECGGPGLHGSPETCSHIVSSAGIVMLTVGDGSKFHSGLLIQDLGFQDVSTNTNVVTGAIRLLNTEDFNLTNVHCRNIKGSSIPTDITIPGESKPLAPVSGSRRLYVDSGAGNGSDLTVERSDGTVVDLEGGLLSYQIAKAAMGSGTVYTFSVPSIPAGKGIRARVFWQCATCTVQAKTFSWQFGSATTAYAAYVSNSAAQHMRKLEFSTTQDLKPQTRCSGTQSSWATLPPSPAPSRFLIRTLPGRSL